MPSWNKKDERQYEHIKEGYEKQGKGNEEAEEIAARTVNKSRREHGHTPNPKTQGTGNPNTSLDDRSADELHNRAKELGIDGESSMSKDDLIAAIRKANR
jgi:hypothetical protein